MFEVGFTELLVIFVLALIVLGPEKLPRLAQQVGRWIGRARSMAKQFREQLEDEVNLADMNKKWEQPSSSSSQTSSQSEPPPAQPTGTPESSAPDAASTTAGDHTSAPNSASSTDAAADNTNASHGHYSGPPPEPEADVYQPPAYASGSGAATPEHPPLSTEPHPSDPDERPLRPGDVITTTHERGT